MQFQASDYWDFSVTVYQLDNVEQCCLQLQNDYHLNVNLLLFALFIAEKNQTLNSTQWQQLIDAAKPWDEILNHLRKSRQLLKSSPLALTAEFKDETRECVLKVELNTERMQQKSIIDGFKTLESETDEQPIAVIARQNIMTYIAQIVDDTINNEMMQLIDTLMQRFESLQANNQTIAQ